MTKKFLRKILSVPLIIMLFMFSGCQEISQSGIDFKPSIPMTQYQISEGIDFFIPEEYQEKDSQSGNRIFKSNSASIVISHAETNPQYDTVDKYSFYAMTEYTKLFDDFNLENEETYALRDTSAKVNEITYRISGETESLEMSSLIGYIIYDGETYVITCSATPENYEKNKDGFSQTIKSFSFSQ